MVQGADGLERTFTLRALKLDQSRLCQSHAHIRSSERRAQRPASELGRLRAAETATPMKGGEEKLLKASE